MATSLFTGICVNADLILARVAILRGDPEGYANAVEDIKRCTKETRSLYLLRMADICIAALSLVLGSTEGVARWIWDMDHIRRALYAPAVPLAQMLYSGVLIIEKRFSEFFGISQSMMDLAESMHYLVPSVIHHILLAVAKHRNGKDREARGHLRDALILAIPDRIFLPFAQDWDEMGPLLEAVLADSAAIGTSWGSPPPCAEGGSNPTMPQTEAMSTIPFREGETAAALLALCKRQAKGASAVRKALIKTKSPLTPREREIALLVKDRLSAQEIADKLHISKATVKTVIRNVYHKLGIHSRTELNSVAF